MTVVKYLLLIHFSKMNKSYSALKSQCYLSSCFQYLYAASHYYKSQIQAVHKTGLILHNHPYPYLEYYERVKHHHHPFVSFFNGVSYHKSSIKSTRITKTKQLLSFVVQGTIHLANIYLPFFGTFLLSPSLSRKVGKPKEGWHNFLVYLTMPN